MNPQKWLSRNKSDVEIRSIQNKKEKAAKLYLKAQNENIRLSMNDLAKEFEIHISSVQRAVNAIRNGREVGKSGHPPALTTKEESILVADILSKEKSFSSPTVNKVLQSANELIENRKLIKFEEGGIIFNSKNPIKSRSTIYGIIEKKNLNLSTGYRTDAERADVTFEEVSNYFDLLKELFEEYKFKPHNIWNCDETIALKNKQNNQMKVVTSKEFQTILVRNADNFSHHMTFMVAINATGKYLEPTLITSRKTITKEDVKEKKLPISWVYSKKGWMEMNIFIEWVKKIFIPGVKKSRRSKSEWCLLVLDGHSSRFNKEILKYMKKHRVHVVTLPSHASHFLQPLDLTVFGTYHSNLKNILIRKELKELLFLMYNCLYKALSPLAITNGFKRSGIYPFSRSTVYENPMCPQEPDKKEIRKGKKKKKRKRINLNGRLLTSSEVLDLLKRKKKSKKK